MKNRKKIVSLLLVTAMTAAFAGCGEKAPANTVNSIEDLDGKTIGVQLGTTGDIYASDKEGDDAGTKIERYNKGTDAVQALKIGKIDCVIIDEQPAKAFIEKNDDLKILDDIFADEEYAFCVSKDNSELTEKFNGALEELKSDGVLDDIIKNYIGDDTKGKTPYETAEGTEYPNGTLTMATNAAFEPYEYYDGQSVVGIDAELSKAICDKLGYELKIEDMEFDSIIPAVTSGKADFGAAGLTVTEKRLKNIDFTNTYTKARQVIIVRNK